MKKGQMGVNSIIALIVIAATLAVSTPIIQAFLNVATGYNALTDTIIGVILPMIWIGFIAAIFFYARNGFAGAYQGE